MSINEIVELLIEIKDNFRNDLSKNQVKALNEACNVIEKMKG
jgi:hypothetical protein